MSKPTTLLALHCRVELSDTCVGEMVRLPSPGVEPCTEYLPEHTHTHTVAVRGQCVMVCVCVCVCVCMCMCVYGCVIGG